MFNSISLYNSNWFFATLLYYYFQESIDIISMSFILVIEKSCLHLYLMRLDSVRLTQDFPSRTRQSVKDFCWAKTVIILQWCCNTKESISILYTYYSLDYGCFLCVANWSAAACWIGSMHDFFYEWIIIKWDWKLVSN